MKSKIYTFNPTIYPFPLLVSKDFDVEELKDLFYGMISNTEVEDFNDELYPRPGLIAKTVQVMRKDNANIYSLVLLYRPKLIRTDEIAHESSHVTDFYTNILGLSSNPLFGEARAYLLGWIAGCVESVLKNKPESRNGSIYK